MSFDENLFSMDVIKPKRKNGKKRKNGNGSAKSAARGFESPGFFEGLQVGAGGGIPKIDAPIDRGLQIPELGEGFNSRFGQIGSGFVEQTNTFKVGFTDVLTGNGRSGEIIGGVGGRKVGRPRGTGKVGRPRKVGRPKGSGVKGVISGGGVGAAQPATRTLGAALATGIKQKLSRPKATSQFTLEQIEAEGTIDRSNVQQLQTGLQSEIESQIEEKDLDMTDEEVEEEDEEVMDEEMESSEFESTNVELGRGQGKFR